MNVLMHPISLTKQIGIGFKINPNASRKDAASLHGTSPSPQSALPFPQIKTHATRAGREEGEHETDERERERERAGGRVAPLIIAELRKGEIDRQTTKEGK